MAELPDHDLRLHHRRRRLGGLRAGESVDRGRPLPNVVSGNTNAATIMIAEKGADIILEDARAS
jgi:choline dehydrogenase